MTEEFRLNRDDRQGQTWQKLRAHINHKIEVARLSLESPDSSEQSTNIARGQIRAFRYLLSLDKDDTQVTAAS